MVSGVKFDDDASLPQELEVNDFLNMTLCRTTALILLMHDYVHRGLNFHF